ncbi:MAG: cobalamin-dependent protein [Planctomycetes bacterium]|nr:cobalamin-dependent protein [Planctomycetota bacterium]
MSRVLLISSNTCAVPYAVYPLGMATVAGALRAAGHEVRQFDWLVAGRDAGQLQRAIDVFDPEVVALSIRNIDRIEGPPDADVGVGDPGSLVESAAAWELGEARDVVAWVRQFTKVPVLAGGAAVSVMPQEVRQYVGADLAVPGEGEQAIAGAAAAVTQGRSVPTVWPLAPERLCGARQCSPCFDPDLVAYYRDKTGIIGLQSKRGCPYHCCYCTYPDLEGTQIRARDIEAVVADLERLQRDFHVDTVFFVDSVFNDPQGQYLELAQTLARRNLGVRWAAYLSPRGLTAGSLKLCRRAGLYAVELGTDATTDTTLEGMGKPFRWAEVAQTNRMLVQREIACAHFVIFGGPGETPATVREGLDNIARLDHCVVLAFTGVRVYPRTPLQRRAVAEHLVRDTDSLFEPIYYISPLVDKAWMERQVLEAWAGRRDRIFPPQQGQRAAAVLRAFGWKGLLWDRLICFPSGVARGPERDEPRAGRAPTDEIGPVGTRTPDG